MSLKYEPSSVPLHISAKWLFLNPATARRLNRGDPGSGKCPGGTAQRCANHLFTPYEIRRDSVGPYGKTGKHFHCPDVVNFQWQHVLLDEQGAVLALVVRQ